MIHTDKVIECAITLCVYGYL